MSATPNDRDGPSGQNQSGNDAQKEAVLKQLLEPSARLRLANIRMVKPELAGTVENYLLGLVSQGRISSMVTDEQLKRILLSIQQPKREFRINRR
jgi:programmed cell death protein 5